jgi:hypothetical protein
MKLLFVTRDRYMSLQEEHPARADKKIFSPSAYFLCANFHQAQFYTPPGSFIEARAGTSGLF